MLKKNSFPVTLICLFLFMGTLLLFPGQCLSFALTGLNLWFQKMIPSLFPFMVLSGILIRMDLTDRFVSLLRPLLTPVFMVNTDCLYVIIIGFLCGFPMGAVAVTDLYKKGRLSVTEGEFLLSFCNNIGPVYFISFALPIMGNPPLLPCLFGMYGIPLLYGIVLRHTRYRYHLSASTRKTPDLCQASYEKEASLLAVLDESVTASLYSITKLGGYMILFQILNVYPSLFFRQGLYPGIAQGLLEISGGLSMLQDTSPCISLILLVFCGLCCLAQTGSVLAGSPFSLVRYFNNRFFLTGLCAFYYVVFFSVTA